MSIPDHTTYLLAERIKELTLLHATARLLQEHSRPTAELLSQLVELIPAAWQYPEIASARIICDDGEYRTDAFSETAWVQSTHFDLDNNRTGSIEVCYTESRPVAAEGPFLAEERQLLDSLGEMVRQHILHRESDEALHAAQARLEEQVTSRTRELESTNRELKRQLDDHNQAQAQIRQYQQQLAQLSLELSLTEARERREIAEDLHDHVGQALAFAKIKVSQFGGNAVFCGFENTISEIISLLDQTIAYTRNLTLQISPPVLYEFGLAAALEWLAGSMSKSHGIKIKVTSDKPAIQLPPEIAALLFKSAKELLTNAVKHSGCSRIEVSLKRVDRTLRVEVRDNGKGFMPESAFESAARTGKFGLFSVRERMRLLGGDLAVSSIGSSATTASLIIPLEQYEKKF